MVSLFRRLPLGGKALPRSGGDEGQSDSEQFVINRSKSEFRLITWLPLGGRLLAKQGGEGQLHLRFAKFSNKRAATCFPEKDYRAKLQ